MGNDKLFCQRKNCGKQGKACLPVVASLPGTTESGSGQQENTSKKLL